MFRSLDSTYNITLSKVLIRSTADPKEYLGIVSDRQLLSWFAAYAKETPSFHQYSSKPLNSFALPSLNLHSAVVSATSNASVLDAMRLMSEDGVSSVAVLDDDTGRLLSAVSVTDIGRVRILRFGPDCMLMVAQVVVPSGSNQILSMPLNRFVAMIKVCHLFFVACMRFLPCHRPPMVQPMALTNIRASLGCRSLHILKPLMLFSVLCIFQQRALVHDREATCECAIFLFSLILTNLCFSECA